MEKQMKRLLETNEKLLESIDRLTKALERAEKKNAHLEEQVRLLTHKRFGASSGKTDSNQLSFLRKLRKNRSRSLKSLQLKQLHTNAARRLADVKNS